jgi:UPF0755 protein
MPGDVYNFDGDSRYSKHNTAYRGQRDYSVLPRSPSEALEPDRAPEPPRGGRQRRQHPIFVFFNRLITLVLIGLIAFFGLLYFVRQQFNGPGPLAYPTVFVVPKGEGINAIARRLQQEGVVEGWWSRWTFAIAAWHFDMRDKIKAGEYNIRANASLRDVLDTLVKGRSILFSVSIPEGLTSYQVVDRLNAQPELVGDITTVPREGSLLPDTYLFARGTSRDELIRRMQGEQKKFVDGLWAGRSPDLGLTEDQALNLASIVEKEASKADERPRVAEVYLNRLRKRMRLEADPTIIYAASGGKGGLGRPILKSELDTDSPFNSYKNYGLPPTPIANPGRAAIEAVLHPAKTNDLFFVADGTGGHVFAETLAEHQRNVARWRTIEKEQRAEQQEAAAAKAESAPAPAAAPVDVNKLQLVEIPLPQRNPRR